MHEGYKKSDEFLQKDELHFLLTKVKEIKRLNDHVLPLLDNNIRKGCQVANMANSQLILLVQNASIATSIRYNKAALLTKFSHNKLLKRFTDIHCIVRIPNTNTENQQHWIPRIRAGTCAPPSEQHKMQLLSDATALMIMGISETIDDPKLKAIMEKIASHKK